MRLCFIICLLTLTISSQAQDFRFGKVSKEELQEAAHPTDQEATAAVLFRQMNTDFKYNKDDGFYAVTEVFERRKIYNNEGLDWATVEVPLFKGSGSSEMTLINLKAYTYNLIDGKIEREKLNSKSVFEEERSEYLEVTKFTMPAIKNGAVIEFEYTLTSSFISDIDPYYFQETIPVNRVEIAFYAPEYLKYKTHRKGWLRFNIDESTKRDYLILKTLSAPSNDNTNPVRGNTTSQRIEFISNVFKVELSDIPAIKEEPLMSNLNSYRSALQFELDYTKYPNSPLRMYSTTWDVIAADINKSASFGDQLGEKRFFRKTLESIISENDAQGEKISKIYSFVRNSIEWNDFKGLYTQKGVRKALDEGSGNVADINLLLVGLLRAAGLQANPILISSKENGIPIFPTRTGFDYVIAGVGEGKNPLLLDAADRSSAPQTLNVDLLNWNGRLVDEEGNSQIVNLFPPKNANHTALVSYTFDEGLNVEGLSRNRISGHRAQDMRFTFGNINEEDQLLIMEKQFTETTISDQSFKDMDNVVKPLTHSYSFANESLAEVVGDKMYITALAHLAYDKNELTAASRTYPIDFLYPTEDRFTFGWQIPEGYDVSSLPEDLEIKLENNLGRYLYGAKQVGREIKITVHRDINVAVASAKTYDALKQFFKLITEKENEKIVLSKI